jgi:hypothetical protein
MGFGTVLGGLNEGLGQGVSLYNALQAGPAQQQLRLAQAQKAMQEADPNSPMNQMEKARAANFMRQANAPMVDIGDLVPTMKGKGLRVTTAEALPYLIGKQAPGAAANSAVGAPGGVDIFQGLSTADRKTMGQVLSAAQQVNATANSYQNGKLDKAGAWGLNAASHLLPASMAGPMTSRINPELNDYNQQNELLTDQIVPLVTGNPRAAAQVRDVIRKNVMVEPGTEMGSAQNRFAQIYRDIKSRMMSQGRLTQPVADMLDELTTAQGAGQVDKIMAKYHGLVPMAQGGAAASDVQTASSGPSADDISSARRVITNPSGYPPEFVAQAKAILGLK